MRGRSQVKLDSLLTGASIYRWKGRGLHRRANIDTFGLTSILRTETSAGEALTALSAAQAIVRLKSSLDGTVVAPAIAAEAKGKGRVRIFPSLTMLRWSSSEIVPRSQSMIRPTARAKLRSLDDRMVSVAFNRRGYFSRLYSRSTQA